ncbi:DUF447 domain-containing protein [Aporhodopirellula aestuarii]|uniref:DUF447 family protein n=1 Tax=Aporhodopirellula aestuarii TaxID=2950107 RepID=A0ABT0U0Z8_9BACT|nr:DUF447 domain-containing protein [Aporhodopirellula aestuarii]MCM2370567.1 DUF447 family protein [Aporhodopirellula aestuarii]
MILESIVTTLSPDGRVNIAPMGPVVQEPREGETLPTFLLRPYEGSRTCRNLLASGKAVIHVTDDVLLLARAAVGDVDPVGLVCPAENVSEEYFRLIDCHRWFAIEVTHRAGEAPRHELTARCVGEGSVRPFFGFNRAKHAVIEAAILATRIGLIDAAQIREAIHRLRVPVEKTAGPDEHAAFELVVTYIHKRLLAMAESSA